MPIRLLRPLVVLVMAVSYPLAAAELGATALGDDRATTAHESAVLDRIFTNWKARQDRVHTLHFTWDCRSTIKKGRPDPSKLGAKLANDQVLEQFGVQLWIEGDDRICVTWTPIFMVSEVKVTDASRLVQRCVSVGEISSVLYVSRSLQTGTSNLPEVHYGEISRNVKGNGWLTRSDLQPLLLTFRPQNPAVSWSKEQCRILDENSSVEGGRCEKFQRIIDPSDARLIDIDSRSRYRREEACWVSPVRDDVIVRWTIDVKSRFEPSFNGSIRYRNDKTYGWIPAEWRTESTWGKIDECRVTSYAINEPIDPATFSMTFPPGTPVSDHLNGSTAQTVRDYVVQPDGSKRSITWQEFNHLAGFPDPKKLRAAPRAGRALPQPPAKRSTDPNRSTSQGD
jgi:hypothetical protein